MKIVIIDNYDSFTYNLFGFVRDLGFDCQVIRNDKFQLKDLEKFDKIILSPGPGIPSESGLLLDVIQEYADKKPILGVCLGHQAIGEVFGGKLTNISEVYHGVATDCTLFGNDYIFNGLDKNITIGRYHSWVVDKDGLPDCLEITAESPDGLIMGLKHKTLDVHGIQFHPESVLTPKGKEILKNFLKA
ncbi:MAG: aminodeoxychorismate/anthranilate synthase component II [Bacteroidales bacterium]|nr:aminodeoxychorismate/anthranilate synthase component II [Bacteroidales bacterium]